MSETQEKQEEVENQEYEENKEEQKQQNDQEPVKQDEEDKNEQELTESPKKNEQNNVKSESSKVQNNQQGPSQKTQKMNTSQVDQDCTVFLAMKQKNETIKNIDLLQNRVQLLKREEDRMLKRINDTRDKTKQMLENKKRNEDMNQKKNTNQQNDGDLLKLMQKKSFEIRKQQEEERKAIRLALLELKREETLEIKRQSEANLKKITYQRERHMQQKISKHEKVQQLKEQSRHNIENYWQNRLQYLNQQQESTKHYHLQVKSQKDQELERLEHAELGDFFQILFLPELIKRLQYSQQVHQDVQKEQEQVAQMSAKEYLGGQNNNQQLERRPSEVSRRSSKVV